MILARVGDKEQTKAVTGADLGFLYLSRTQKAFALLGGSGGMLPRKILKSRTPEMPFTAFLRLDSAVFRRL